MIKRTVVSHQSHHDGVIPEHEKKEGEKVN